MERCLDLSVWIVIALIVYEHFLALILNSESKISDGSGAIGIDELESAMRNLGLEPQKNELEQIIEEVDQVDFNFL